MVITYQKDAKVEDVIELFQEYSKIEGAEVCFVSFQNELEHLEEIYSYPKGITILAYQNGEPVGCVAAKKKTHSEIEMKRLYVKPEYRKTGVAGKLIDMVIEYARNNAYEIVSLETLPGIMDDAIRLYKKCRFNEVGSQDGVLSMERKL